ncbi:predicted protein [Naegleria gruberi]|uniref:Predicted protein n=1 Tax=Naegleria gruberi TaxID=5762 RepID=D2W1N8_NAEGR|nr:uncharacterized protein NAEGRDRAFT_75321 [Naegleria gruberi]EFC36995.1 predicted protein [Naegleria gruberi]|eukprot:XP_002669739.1 predicted protein [Naegleria gruberi strain NEG-M]
MYAKRKKEILDSRMDDFLESTKNWDLHEQLERKKEMEKEVEEEMIENGQKDYLTPRELVFFRCAIGLVYQSLGNDELALSEFMEAKKFAQAMNDSDSSIPLSCIGSVFYHVGQFLLAQKYYTKSLEIRQTYLGEGVDTAVSMINVAACLQCVGDFPAAHDMYNKGISILNEKLGPSHPRSSIANRNFNRFRTNFLKQ